MASRPLTNVVYRDDGTCWKVAKVLHTDHNSYQGECMWVKIEFSKELTEFAKMSHEEYCQRLVEVAIYQDHLEKELARLRKRWGSCMIV